MKGRISMVRLEGKSIYVFLIDTQNKAAGSIGVWQKGKKDLIKVC